MATREKRTIKKKAPVEKAPAAKAPAKKAKGPKAEAKAAQPRARSARGGSALVIVESPTKAKTIGKYLGSGYDVKATIGHLRDLPTRELGVDVERGFEPKYVTIKGKTKTLSELKKAAKGAREIYLATDPDREGEAIAWHVADQIGRPACRPTGCSSRRSPATPCSPRCSGRADRRAQGGRAAGPPHPRPAGRLQGEPDSLAHHQDRSLRRPGADRRPPPPGGARAGDPRLQAAGVLEHRGAARQGRADLRGLARQGGRAQAAASQRGRRAGRGGRAGWGSPAGAVWTVTKVEKRQRRKNGRLRPSPPARCSRRPPRSSASPAGAPCARRRISTRAWTSARTARSVSSPTCERTRCACRNRRSPRRRELHREPVRQAAISPTRRWSTSAGKNARVQDAHEAIRPDRCGRRPERVQRYLEPDQFRLYQLIWQRFVASQMTPAVYDMTVVEFDLGQLSVPRHRLGRDLRRLPRPLHRGAGDGGGARRSRTSRRFRRSPRATRSRSARSRRRSTSPSRRRASPRRAW